MDIEQVRTTLEEIIRDEITEYDLDKTDQKCNRKICNWWS